MNIQAYRLAAQRRRTTIPHQVNPTNGEQGLPTTCIVVPGYPDRDGQVAAACVCGGWHRHGLTEHEQTTAWSCASATVRQILRPTGWERVPIGWS